jgi:hypothetical protein
MIRIFCLLLTSIFITLLSLLVSANPSKKDEPKVRIGTYDSRVIAFAYSSSSIFLQERQQLNTKLETAKTSGDRVQILLFERTLSKLQNIIQKQIFSTYPVIDILEKFNDEISEITSNANVSCIVSKWEVVYMGEDVEVVDLTTELAGLFTNKEAVRNMYPPEGIPDPRSLMEIEGLSLESGISDIYEEGPDCLVTKKDYNASETDSKIIGRWKAEAIYIHGRNMLGQKSLIFTFLGNGLVQMEEPHSYIIDGEWFTGLNENSIMLIMREEKNSLTGRYDFYDGRLTIAGRGFVGLNEYVCLTLKKVDP